MAFKIEDGILPGNSVAGAKRGPVAETLSMMSKGQSFLLPKEFIEEKYRRNDPSGIANAIRSAAVTAGRKVSVRAQPCGGYRVWVTGVVG